MRTIINGTRVYKSKDMYNDGIRIKNLHDVRKQ